MLIKSWDGQVSKNRDEIEQILRQNVIVNSGYENLLNQTNDELGKLEKIRKYSEFQCFQTTGMDRRECTDKETCVLAAMSTPISNTAVQADGFWESMLKYRQDNEKLVVDLNELQKSLDGANPNSDDAKKIKEAIANVEAIAPQFEDNPLLLTIGDEGCQFGGDKKCFNFCPKLNWSIAHKGKWQWMEIRWAEAASNLSALDLQAKRADEILNNTNNWVEYTKNKQELWHEAQGQLQDAKDGIEAGLKKMRQAGINDSGLESDYAKWVLKLNGTNSLIENRQYYNALKIRDELLHGSALISEKAENDSKMMQNAKDILENIKKLIGQTSTNDSEKMQEIKNGYDNVSQAINSTVDAKDLLLLESQAKGIENDALLLFAKTKIEIKEVNVGNESNIINKNASSGNGAKASGANSNANAPKEEPIDPLGALIKAILNAIAKLFSGK